MESSDREKPPLKDLVSEDVSSLLESLSLSEDRPEGLEKTATKKIPLPSLPPGLTVSSKFLFIENLHSDLPGDVQVTVPFSAPHGHSVSFYAVSEDKTEWVKQESGSFNYGLGRIAFAQAHFPRALCRQNVSSFFS